MGVKELWSIVDPVKKHVPLSELSGQTLAVDLSIWMCDTQQLQGRIQKPHLRNIFFRVSKLMQLGIKPVFVIDGAPPEIKWLTIQKRLASSYGSRKGFRKVPDSIKSQHSCKMSRSHFKRLSKECCEMLDTLGIPYLQSTCEAEALCAVLNQEGVVDACITNDGDAFLYGARTVYRNFTLNTKDPHVEAYSMADIERQLKLDRERLVALALLLGCDYLPEGVPGVGKKMALDLLTEITEGSILNRFRSWPHDPLLQEADVNTKKYNHCACCGHIGSKKEHAIHGCQSCRTSRHCDSGPAFPCRCPWHSKSSEIMIWKKAKRIPGFPSQKIIDEFLIQKDVITKVSLSWKRPKPLHFQRFAAEKMEWAEAYAIEKVIPLLTLYEMRSLEQGGTTTGILKPHRIIKARTVQKVPCFEVEWYKLDEDDVTEQDYYITVEEQDIISVCFPKLVKEFTSGQMAKKCKSKGIKSCNGRSGKPVVKCEAPTTPFDLDTIFRGLKISQGGIHLDGHASCSQPSGGTTVNHLSTGTDDISQSIDSRLQKGKKDKYKQMHAVFDLEEFSLNESPIRTALINQDDTSKEICCKPPKYIAAASTEGNFSDGNNDLTSNTTTYATLSTVLTLNIDDKSLFNYQHKSSHVSSQQKEGLEYEKCAVSESKCFDVGYFHLETSVLSDWSYSSDESLLHKKHKQTIQGQHSGHIECQNKSSSTHQAVEGISVGTLVSSSHCEPVKLGTATWIERKGHKIYVSRKDMPQDYCDQADVKEKPSPVLLSLSDRLKLKLGYRGKVILSSLTNVKDVNVN